MEKCLHTALKTTRNKYQRNTNPTNLIMLHLHQSTEGQDHSNMLLGTPLQFAARLYYISAKQHQHYLKVTVLVPVNTGTVSTLSTLSPAAHGMHSFAFLYVIWM